MSKSPFQKLKILYVMELLLRNSDEGHPVSINQILIYLAEHGITAERKSIYDDIESLRHYGLDIVQTSLNRSYGYYVATRDFELPELKLLVDSVQSSKFITHKKTASLIKKIEMLASVHEAQLLQRQVYVSGRVKTMNESIYYNVDAIHNGISQNRKIRFKYFEFTVDKKRRYRKDGALYEVSPFALTWDNENYYLIAYDSTSACIKHYRVDKMTEITTSDEERDGSEAYEALDLATYTRKVFGMFAGDEISVRLRFENHLVGAVLDRLGQETIIIPDTGSHFTVTASVVTSPQFFAWVFGFGKDAEILSPQSIVRNMEIQLQEVERLYTSRSSSS